MVMTPSRMVPLGTEAPDFSLPDTVSGKTLSLDDVKGEKATVVAFICNHCPFVVHLREQFVALARAFMPQGVGFVAISSNDVANYPDDAPEKMKELAEELDFPFPYLYDETQEVAQAYEAACTPDFFVYDSELKLVYRGRFDNTRPNTGQEATGEDLRKALEDIVAGREVSVDQQPSVGCNVKWKQG